MLNAATMRALATIADRTNELMHSGTNGFESVHGDVNVGPERTVPALDPLATTAPAGTYFVTETARGERRYTRDGAFAFVDGTLAAHGDAVLGFPPGARVLEPLRLDRADAALGRAAALHVEPDGTVAYERSWVDARTAVRRGERVVVGTIALARFPPATHLQRDDALRAAAPAGVTPHVGRPGDESFAPLRTQTRDRGRFDVVTAVARLQDAYLAFEALHAAQRAHGASDKVALDLVK